MATGLPVIASAVSGIPEIVQDGRGGFLIEPGDEKVLSDRIRWLLQHPDAALEMGHQAQCITAKLFSSALYLTVRSFFEGVQQVW
jgi:glycosyltransferase involved in cell wall biosynthesis